MLVGILVKGLYHLNNPHLSDIPTFLIIQTKDAKNKRTKSRGET